MLINVHRLYHHSKGRTECHDFMSIDEKVLALRAVSSPLRS